MFANLLNNHLFIMFLLIQIELKYQLSIILKVYLLTEHIQNPEAKEHTTSTACWGLGTGSALARPVPALITSVFAASTK